MKNNKEITDAYVGMRIKIALPTSWCQVHSDSSIQWLKGKVIEVSSNGNAIVVSIWSKKVGRINRMQCFKRDGHFENIIKQL